MLLNEKGGYIKGCNYRESKITINIVILNSFSEDGD